MRTTGPTPCGTPRRPLLRVSLPRSSGGSTLSGVLGAARAVPGRRRGRGAARGCTGGAAKLLPPDVAAKRSRQRVHFRQLLSQGEHGREAVPVPLEARERRRGLEREPGRSAGAQRELDVPPRDGRRHRGPLPSPERPGAHRRLVRVVLAPVHEDLPAPERLLHRGDDEVGPLRLEVLGHRPGEALRLGVAHGRVEGEVDLEPLRPGDLGECGDLEPVEDAAQQERHLAARDEIGRRPRVEVEHGGGGRLDSGRAVEVGVHLQICEVRGPHEGGEVVDDAEADDAPVVLAPDLGGLHPARPVRRAALLVEERPGRAVRVALQRERAVAQVREEGGGGAGVVIDHVALGEGRSRLRATPWPPARVVSRERPGDARAARPAGG